MAEKPDYEGDLKDMQKEMEKMLPAIPDAAPPAVRTEVGTVKVNPFHGIASEAFTAEEQEVLRRPVKDDEIWVINDRTGLVYVPQMIYRERLNEAFGVGAWGLQVRSITYNEPFAFYEGALFVKGRFVAQAVGEGRYIAENPRDNMATAAEKAKSDCLTRCCKDLGMFHELWIPGFAEDWKSRHAYTEGGKWYRDESSFGAKTKDMDDETAATLVMLETLLQEQEPGVDSYGTVTAIQPEKSWVPSKTDEDGNPAKGCKFNKWFTVDTLPGKVALYTDSNPSSHGGWGVGTYVTFTFDGIVGVAGKPGEKYLKVPVSTVRPATRDEDDGE